MEIKILREAGYNEALLGLSLNKNQPVDNMAHVAEKLCDKDKGHNKFLRFMTVWLQVRAPRYWWQEYSTYKVGSVENSESTMHTMMKNPITQDNFVSPIYEPTIIRLQELLSNGDFLQLKKELPEGWLQTRVICCNYATLRNILQQRTTHRLPEWQEFCAFVSENVQYRELLK